MRRGSPVTGTGDAAPGGVNAATWAVRRGAVLLVVTMLAVIAPTAAEADLSPGTWSADYTSAPAFAGDIAYVRPGILGVKETVGAAAVTRASDGTLLPAAVPQVTGRVVAVTGDGAGGWFLGGSFTHVGGLRRRNIAHVLADGTVAANFDPGGPATVSALALHRGRLYVSSAFPGPIPARPVLEALDTATGRPVASWQPPKIGQVTVMQAAGDSLYVGGNLIHAGNDGGSVTVMELDAETGARRAWAPAVTDEPSALAVSDDTVLIGGRVRYRSDLDNRYGVVAVDRTTGTPRWATKVSDEGFDRVHALAVTDRDVVIGGDFSSVDGAARTAIAKLDANTGRLDPWKVDVAGEFHDLAVRGRTVHAVGEISRVGGMPRRGGAAISLDTGAIEPWDPGTSSWRQVVAVQDDHVLVGGSFVGAGPRRGGLGDILRVLPDGTLDTDWVGPSIVPQPFVDIEDTAVLGTTLFLAGSGIKADGRAAANLVAVDLTTGDVRNWSTPVTGNITNIVATEDRLIIAGWLRLPGMSDLDPVHRLLAIDPDTGRPDDWRPELDGEVLELEVHEDRLYVGGQFHRVGRINRVGGASFSLPDLTLTPWDPQAEQIRSIAAHGDRVVIGGGFDDVGRTDREALAIVDAATGTATDWTPPRDSPGSIDAVAFDGQQVLAAGNFDRVAGLRRAGLVAFDAISGAVRPWDTNLTGETYATALTQNANQLWVTGAFNGLAGASRGGLAIVDLNARQPDAGDDTPPTVTVTAPIAGATYPSESAVPTAFTCDDEAGGSGLASCRAADGFLSYPDRQFIFSVAAYDRDGNVGRQQVSFTISPTPPTPDPPTAPEPPTTPEPPTPTSPDPPTPPEPPTPSSPDPPTPPNPDSPGSTNPGGPAAPEAPPLTPTTPAGGDPPATAFPGWLALLGTVTGAKPQGEGRPAAPSSTPGVSPGKAARKIAGSKVLTRIVAGRATRAVVASVAPAGARATVRVLASVGGRRVTVARGTAVATAAGRVRVVVRATATGRRRLRAARSVNVIASIASVGDAPVEHRRQIRGARP